MAHPDFRIEGKIFATLGYPDENWAMVKLTPDQQRTFVVKASDVFAPCNGAWGRRGATNVHLPSASKSLVKAALQCAFRNASAMATNKTV